MRFVVMRGGGKGNWIKAVKRYKLPVIKEVSTSNVMYNMINTINTAICYKSKLLKRVNLEFSSQRKTIFSNCIFI